MDTGFSQSDILTIISIVVGAAVGVFAIFITVRQNKKKNLTYYIESRLVLDISDHPDFERRLTMLFDQKNVSKLSMVEISIWNSGNDVVDREMLVACDPLRIEVKEGGQIVDARIKKSSSIGCNVNLTRIEEEGPIVRDIGSMSYASIGEICKRVEMDFDYLNPGEGAKLSVVHSGAPEDAMFAGALKGGELIDYNKKPLVIRGIHKLDRFFIVAFSIPIFSLLYYWSDVKAFLLGGIESWRIPTGILAIVYGLHYYYIVYVSARRKKLDEIIHL